LEEIVKMKKSTIFIGIFIMLSLVTGAATTYYINDNEFNLPSGVIDGNLAIDPAPGDLFASLFNEPGDLYVNAEIFSRNGITMSADRYGIGAAIFGSNLSKAVVRNSTTGYFIGSLQYLCDDVVGFTQQDLDDKLLVQFGKTTEFEVASEILALVNSTCIELQIATEETLPDINPVLYSLAQNPLMYVMDGGVSSFKVGGSANSKFKINSVNSMGDHTFQIEDIVGIDSHQTASIDQDTINYSGNSALHLKTYSSTGAENVHTDLMVMEADGTGLNESVAHFIHASLLGSPGADSSATFAVLDPRFESIIKIGTAQTLDKAYYDNTVTTVDVTTDLTSGTGLVSLFEVDDSILYLQNTANYTRIGFSLAVGASATILPEYYYCNSSSEWEQIIGVSDSTSGFTSSGTVSFSNPLNRGVCNKEIDGTPFANSTNFVSFAIKRTRNNIVVPPIASLVTISGGENSFLLQDDLIKLNPVSAPSYICDGSTFGAMYVDIELGLPCFCNSVDWVQMNDFSTVCT